MLLCADLHWTLMVAVMLNWIRLSSASQTTIAELIEQRSDLSLVSLGVRAVSYLPFTCSGGPGVSAVSKQRLLQQQLYKLDVIAANRVNQMEVKCRLRHNNVRIKKIF